MSRTRILFTLLGCALTLTAARAEQVLFTEIMYAPAGGKPEFIEVFNMSMTPLDMAKWKFSDGVVYEFPDFNPGAVQAHFLKPLERIVVSAADEATTRAAYGIGATVRVFGPWTGALDNAGERVTLNDKNGVITASVSYGNGGRWPKAANGAGHWSRHVRHALSKMQRQCGPARCTQTNCSNHLARHTSRHAASPLDPPPPAPSPGSAA